MRKIKILIADDHPMFLEQLKELLEKLDWGSGVVIDAVENGRALVEAARILQPDLILTDISMPWLNGLESARQIKKINPLCKIIFLTMHLDPTYASEAFRAGGSGYLVKSSAATELQEAIATVLGGRTYLTPLLKHQGSVFPRKSHDKGPHLIGKLTARQREVLQWLAEGHSTKEIAMILGISVKTAESHRTKIREVLGLHTIAELTQYAVNHGLIESSSRSSHLALPRGN